MFPARLTHCIDFISPTQVAFTPIFSGANSFSENFFKFRPADRITEVGKVSDAGAFTPPLLALIIQPPPLALIEGITSSLNLTAAITFRLNSASQSLSFKSSSLAATETPALFIKKSIPPNLDVFFDIRLTQSSGLVTSEELCAFKFYPQPETDSLNVEHK